MNLLKRVHIKGFKSIRDQELEFRMLNILIGGNGAGKSNLLSFFELINKMKEHELSAYIIEQGGANSILYNGRKATEECQFALYRDRMMFYARLKVGKGDNLYFATQGAYDVENRQDYYVVDGSEDLREQSVLMENRLLEDIGIYHFHDTSNSSPMKTMCKINDNLMMASDGRNIAAVLFRIKSTNMAAYQRIVKTIRLVAPYFQDFILRENPLNPQLICLEWKKKGCEVPFGAEQLSDGTLRFICLCTLLCQPDNMRKDVIFIDEPELGLHPFAITVIAELMKKYGTDRQVIAATQSVEFLNEFETEDVIVTDNLSGETEFRRLRKEQLAEWMEDYTIGELWQKNILGGRP